MRELGLRPGTELTVIQKAAFGGRVININGSRLAVDAASTRKMEVEAVEVEASGTTKTQASDTTKAEASGKSKKVDA